MRHGRVRAGGDELRSANVARADSTDCTDCRTVAVAVQAVLVKQSPHISAPTNAAWPKAGRRPAWWPLPIAFVVL